MNLKQFKLTNDDEIICDVIDMSRIEEGEIVVRNVLKIISADDFENNVRYFSFRPLMSFQDDIDQLTVLNIGHIITETLPSKKLISHYTGAMTEIEKHVQLKGELNLDELMVEGSDMDDEEIAEYIQSKMDEYREENKRKTYEVDSASPNIIHFNPSNTKH